MSAASNGADRARGPLGAALEVIDEVDRGLAIVQKDEVIVERVGVMALCVGALALGAVAMIAVAILLVRRWVESPAGPDSPDERAASHDVTDETPTEPAGAETVARASVYHHGTCTVNHRSPETAARCHRTR